MTTATTTMPTTKTRVGVTSARDLKLGEELAPKLSLYTSITPANAPMAIATCRFSVCGFRKGTHNGPAPRDSRDRPQWGQGRWFRTDLTTFGDLPSVHFNHRFGDRATTDKRGRTAHRGLVGRVAWSDNYNGMNDILGAFGLDVRSVLDYYGNPGPDGRLDVSLPTIIRDMTDFA